MQTILTPALILIAWTLVLLLGLYATRLPAMKAAGIDPRRSKSAADFAGLPMKVKQIADNYNHLHEQPTTFYALVFYSHLAGIGDSLQTTLAWSYVGLRVVHSLVQCTINYVPVRFLVFATGSIVLIAMTARAIYALGATF
jgi:hypothetical protein